MTSHIEMTTSRFRNGDWLGRMRCLSPFLPCLKQAKSTLSPFWGGVVVLWIALLDFPVVGAHGPLDDSWQEAYGYCFKHRLQAGVDYIFTFGPLGTFYTSAYDPDLFVCKLIWELIFKLVLALVILRVARFSGRLPAVILFALVLVFLAPLHRESNDALYPFLLVAVSVLTLRNPRFWLLTGYALMLAILCQVKFTFAVQGVVNLVVIVLYLLASGAFQAASLTVGAFAGFLSLTWLAEGQSLLHLPVYIQESLQIASGYPAAMGIPGNENERWLAATFGIVFAALLFTFDIRQARLRAAALVILCGLAFLFSWKHGFTRQPSHVGKFFAFCLLLPFVPAVVLTPVSWLRHARYLLIGAALALAIAGITQSRLDHISPASRSWSSFKDNLLDLCMPAPLRDRLDVAWADLQASRQLPRVRQMVGDATVDVFTFEQCLVFANGLKWKPRPVFQSYSAYTRDLLAINAAALQDRSAAEYLLIRWDPIDDRVPSSEDGLALLEILDRYAPVLSERGYLLLKRQTVERSLPGAPRVIRETIVHLGEDVEIAGNAAGKQVLSLQIRPTWRGRLRAWWYGPPSIFISIHTTEGDSYRFRLIPALAESGFLLNPLLLPSQDFRRLYDGTAPSVRSFRVEGNEEYFEPEIGMLLLGR